MQQFHQILERDEMMLEDSPISKQKITYFKHAKRASMFSDDSRVKIGAVLIYKHKILSIGFNTSKTHPLQENIDFNYFKCDDCTGKLHAETMVLYPFYRNSTNLSGATIVTYREKKDGTLGNSRPCNRCLSLIKRLGIKKLMYTTDTGYAEEKLIY